MSWLLGLFFIGRVALAAVFPSPTGYVNDFGDIISPSTEATLETRLEEFTNSTGNEIAVVTLQSLEGDTVENVAVELFEQWGIGEKGKDNGVLFLVAPNEREMKIEVGYGLEPVLTDARAGRIIRDDVTPEFKNNNYDAGITKGTEAIIAVTSGSDPAPDTMMKDVILDKFDFGATIAVILGIVALLSYLGAFLARSKSIWPGGLIGAILGYIILGIFGVMFFGILGFFFDWLLSKNYKVRKAKKLPTSWKSTWGGFSSGGSRGGFGGFSGGSSGGGGASGRW